MSADDAAQTDQRSTPAGAGSPAASEGTRREALRAQYLPVSRRELRRRREAERKDGRGQRDSDAEAAGLTSAETDAETEAAAEAGAPPRHEADRVAEIDALTAEIESRTPGDPNAVDPELLKKQQALAAEAMQANHARRRREGQDGDSPQDRRPESAIITRKTLRTPAEVDESEPVDDARGEIDPVAASGAHGLEIDEMVEQTSRRASRQSAMLWLVLALSVLLLVAVGIVLYTVLS